MNFSLWIAQRYFLFGEKISFINIVSIISMMVVAFVTMALVIALSVFNGLEDLIRSLFNTFDPEIKITAIQGKSFEVTPSLIAKIKNIKGVGLVTEVIEDNALARYKDEQIVVKIKGVSEAFITEHRIDPMIIEGRASFSKNGGESAIVGQGVQYLLNLNLEGTLYTLQLLYPKAIGSGSLDPKKLVTTENIMPAGVFAIEKQYDDSYIFVSLAFAQRLFGITTKRTALEIKSNGIESIKSIQQRLSQLLGSGYLIQNSDEQHASLLRAVRIEKLFMRVTISFIFAIASLNIFFCLTMLAIKKKKDIAVLYAMGATTAIVKKIFLLEGCLIAFTGSAIGLVAGLAICILQIKYGFVSMGMETSIIDAYPVKLVWTDILITCTTVVVLTILASLRPATNASRTIIKEYI